MKRLASILTVILSLIVLAGCRGVDDERIPNMAVYVNLANTGLWNSYGVAGFGSHRNFIHTPTISEPAGFSYSSKSATGFGGVLLIEGMDPFNPAVSVPLAYDLACPVERQADIRVYIDNETYVAVCRQCHSTYDVTMGGGAPLSGEAMTGKYKYGLRSYRVIPNGTGGYYITN